MLVTVLTYMNIFTPMNYSKPRPSLSLYLPFPSPHSPKFSIFLLSSLNLIASTTLPLIPPLQILPSNIQVQRDTRHAACILHLLNTSPLRKMYVGHVEGMEV